MDQQREPRLEDSALATSASAHGFSAERLGRLYHWMERWVDEGKLPFISALIAHRGQPVFFHKTGMADISAGIAYAEDHIIRIYSMTKPVTSLALMMLYEQGRINLDDPISAYLPEFDDLKVLAPDAVRLDQTEPAVAAPSIHQLLTHQSGFTYGFTGGLLADAYVKHGVDFGPGSGGLKQTVARLAKLPLQFQPGQAWNYSVSTDVIGRLIEVVSGCSLDAFFEEHIFAPLGMADTQFAVCEEKADRLAALYKLDENKRLQLLDSPGKNSAFCEGRVTTLSGGGGLTSTMGDYFRFTEMLRLRGKAGRERLLGAHTFDYMVQNHLRSDIASLGPSSFSETPTTGVGFGIGFWSMIDPARAMMLGSPGDFGWGGIASTVFWRDPVKDLTVMLFTQLVPSNTYPLRKQLRALTYQALID